LAVETIKYEIEIQDKTKPRKNVQKKKRKKKKKKKKKKSNPQKIHTIKIQVKKICRWLKQKERKKVSVERTLARFLARLIQ